MGKGYHDFSWIEDRSFEAGYAKAWLIVSLGQRSEDGDSVDAHCLRRWLKDRGSFRVSRGSGIDDRRRGSSLFFLPLFCSPSRAAEGDARSSGSDQSNAEIELSSLLLSEVSAFN